MKLVFKLVLKLIEIGKMGVKGPKKHDGGRDPS